MRNLKKGFSLVELMIVVAIIGILAAIAIPNFLAMQNKTKRGELPTAARGLKDSLVAYAQESSGGSYLSLTAAPDASPGKNLRDWTSTDSNWTTLGWRPDGQVRGSYSAADAGADFTVGAASDVDGDGNQALYTATTSVNPTLTTPGDYY